MKEFKGKVAAITGAGSGIGRALALDLASQGCALALADIDAGKLAQTQELARPHGVRVTTAALDVSDRDAVVAWAAQSRADHGQVNLIFNNAGVALSAMAETTTPADFEWLMGINFWGVVHGTQAFMPHLRASGDGHVVNISSIFGMMAMPTQAAYNAAKFAVRGYTEALRMELEIEGAPVGVTCVHPGGVGTNIALASRVDPAMERLTGQSAQAHRARGNKMIQVTAADEAARQILAGVRRNARRVLVGPDARFMDLCTRVLGASYQRLVMRMARRIRERDAASAAAPTA